MSQLIKYHHKGALQPQSRQKSTRHPRVVQVCAWCPEKTFISLKSGEVYSHGMCRKHLAEWTSKVRKRLRN